MTIQSDLFKEKSPSNFAKRNATRLFQQKAIELQFPIMDMSALQFLCWFQKLTKPQMILEIGSGFGFVSYHLLSNDPKVSVVGLDYREFHLDWLKEILTETKELNLLRRYQHVVGDATKTIHSINDEFDWVILDIDKRFYPEMIPHVSSKIKKNGYLIADNVLWKGRVADEQKKKNPEPLRIFNQQMIRNLDFETYLLPISDGLLIAKKR